MRLTATSITVLSLLLLSGCDVTPSDTRGELNALKGPSPGGMQDALKDQADQANMAGDYRRAAQTYKQLSDKYPDNKEFTIALADAMRRAGGNQEAIQVLDKYLAKHPDDAGALESKGLCLMNLGSTAEAGKIFEQVMKVEPTRWRTLNAIGILFTIKNKQSDAIAYYDEALSQSPDNVSVLNNKGLTLAMEAKYGEAIEAMKLARRHMRSGSNEAKQVDMNLALIYAIAGRLDDAEETATPYLSKAALYNNMGVYAGLAKNKELSKSYLSMALTQSPTYYERAWKNLGEVSGQGDGASGANSLTNTSSVNSDKPAKSTKASKNKTAKKTKVAPANQDEVKVDDIPAPEYNAAPATSAPVAPVDVER